MLIDFRHKSSVFQITVIKGQDIEVVEFYKYLGSLMDNKLHFVANAEMIFKRAQQRIYCLFKLSILMSLFYKSYIESILICSCWYGNLCV